MEIMLHQNDRQNELAVRYAQAFKDAVELYLVSAYLTEWNADFKLTPSCKHFCFIVGKDFGITRKNACRAVLKWLPPEHKTDFLVADQISGFHPKAAFWRAHDGRTYMLMGSSNLSRAAFDGNVEANALSPISEKSFKSAREWIKWIADRSVSVSEDWLGQYVEAQRKPRPGARKPPSSDIEAPVINFKLPRPKRSKGLLEDRRRSLKIYAVHRVALERLFRRCGDGKITSEQFFRELPQHWGWDIGNRLQGSGWERKGKRADFRELAKSFLSVVAADRGERDGVVRRELDRLHNAGNPARKAFLSEMLCLRFPEAYPVLNNPVQKFIGKHHMRPQQGASEGARYIDLAKKLRIALRANPGYPAKNLAELDHLIWTAYKKQ